MARNQNRSHDGDPHDDDGRRDGDGIPDLLEAHGRSQRRGDTGWRARLRRTRAGALFLKAGVLLLGGAFIALGVAAAVLPGPLTIPPVLLGLWILASEFDWADRLFQRAKTKAGEAWRHAKAKPVTSALSTVAGLAVLVVGVWAVRHYELVGRARDAVGL
ncbi:MAG TPA: PGPGW domain-containing protein [Mycobacteriales bacterium]|nr:PGPGW domain-containing protein [Mycobacteriales bacterium]